MFQDTFNTKWFGEAAPVNQLEESDLATASKAMFNSQWKTVFRAYLSYKQESHSISTIPFTGSHCTNNSDFPSLVIFIDHIAYLLLQMEWLKIRVKDGPILVSVLEISADFSVSVLATKKDCRYADTGILYDHIFPESAPNIGNWQYQQYRHIGKANIGISAKLWYRPIPN